MLVVFGGCGTILYSIKEAGDESAYEACLLSVEVQISYSIGLEPLGSIPVTKQWRKLNDTEERLVLDNLKNRNANFDCYGYSEISTFDAFAGESGWIEVMKTSDSTAVRVEFKEGRSRITSSGFRDNFRLTGVENGEEMASMLKSVQFR